MLDRYYSTPHRKKETLYVMVHAFESLALSSSTEKRRQETVPQKAKRNARLLNTICLSCCFLLGVFVSRLSFVVFFGFVNSVYLLPSSLPLFIG